MYDADKRFKKIFNKPLFKKLFPNKEMKMYNKMHREHHKELIKLARETREWEWSYLHNTIITQIKHMYEYYSAGNNVWQIDESRLEITNQLKHVLDLNSKLEELSDYDCGAKYTLVDGKLKAEYPDDYLEKVKNRIKEENELYVELYSYIGKHIREWWD
jgi:hypothetical protein